MQAPSRYLRLSVSGGAAEMTAVLLDGSKTQCQIDPGEFIQVDWARVREVRLAPPAAEHQPGPAAAGGYLEVA